jgi:hypothetical protein
MYGGDVNDAPAAPLFDHLFSCELRAEECALEVNGEDLLVLLLRRIEHGGARLDAGVVDDDVEASNFLTAASINRCSSAILLTSASTPMTLSPRAATCLSGLRWPRDERHSQ